MDRGKLPSAALVLALAGAILLLPPLALVAANISARPFGIPAAVIYLFAVWLLLILLTAFLSRRLGADERKGKG
jgi:hypothetical protein